MLKLSSVYVSRVIVDSTTVYVQSWGHKTAMTLTQCLLIVVAVRRPRTLVHWYHSVFCFTHFVISNVTEPPSPFIPQSKILFGSMLNFKNSLGCLTHPSSKCYRTWKVWNFDSVLFCCFELEQLMWNVKRTAKHCCMSFTQLSEQGVNVSCKQQIAGKCFNNSHSKTRSIGGRVKWQCSVSCHIF